MKSSISTLPNAEVLGSVRESQKAGKRESATTPKTMVDGRALLGIGIGIAIGY